MDIVKIKKWINTVLGVILTIIPLLATFGLIGVDEVQALTTNIGNLFAAILAAVTAVGGFILVFTGSEPLSTKNVL